MYGIVLLKPTDNELAVTPIAHNLTHKEALRILQDMRPDYPEVHLFQHTLDHPTFIEPPDCNACAAAITEAFACERERMDHARNRQLSGDSPASSPQRPAVLEGRQSAHPHQQQSFES